MDVYAQMAEKIIKTQEGIIGPVALEQAGKVAGLKLDWPKHEVSLDGDKKNILEKLVEQYKGLFGQASVEMCKDAVRSLSAKMPAADLPQLLQ